MTLSVLTRNGQGGLGCATMFLGPRWINRIGDAFTFFLARWPLPWPQAWATRGFARPNTAPPHASRLRRRAAALPLGPAATSSPASPRPFLTETQVLTSRPVLELAATRLDRVGQPYLSVGPDRVSDMQIARGGGAGSKHERRRADCHGPASRGARADA